MHAIRQDTLGGPDVLYDAEVDRPTPGLGEILIQVPGAGSGPRSWWSRPTTAG